MGRLIEQLLDVSRVTQGVIQLQQAPVDLAELAASACEVRRGVAAAKAIDLRAQRSAPVWIDGDASVDGPLTLGRADRPVAIVVTGRLQMHGAVELHGAVLAGDVVWNGSGAAALHGALISQAGYAGDAAPRVNRDPVTLARLSRETGSFVRLPGSWRDF